jgi:hypothetical protein
MSADALPDPSRVTTQSLCPPAAALCSTVCPDLSARVSADPFWE